MVVIWVFDSPSRSACRNVKLSEVRFCKVTTLGVRGVRFPKWFYGGVKNRFVMYSLELTTLGVRGVRFLKWFFGNVKLRIVKWGTAK